MRRAGFALWALCLQFFVAEQVARSGWPGPYSMTRDYISDQGSARSPLHWVMNGSFVLQGLLIFFGAMLVRRCFPSRTIFLLAIAGIGVLLVGLIPEDQNIQLHLWGAGGNFVAGNLAVLLMGAGKSSHWDGRLGVALGLLGLVATGALLFRSGLGTQIGTVERFAAYPLPLWLTWTGLRGLLAKDQHAE